MCEQKRISLVIPVYNESATLPRLFDALRPLIDNELIGKAYDWEVILIDDGSTDNSTELMEGMRLRDERWQFVVLSRNFGKESAMLAGLDHASGDAVVILDADLQDPVEVIPRMIAEWENGYDDVYGRRESRGDESPLRRRLSLAFYRILEHCSDIDTLPNVGDFRLLDRRCVRALREMRETQRYSKGLFSWIGFRKKEIVFDHKSRIEGKSSYSLFSLFNLAIEGITSFTTAPLRLASILGLLTAMCALIYLGWVLIKAIIFGDPVAGYPTIMCVMLFLGSCQLIGLGIIGEYIGRIFNESKRRPPYIVRSRNER